MVRINVEAAVDWWVAADGADPVLLVEEPLVVGACLVDGVGVGADAFPLTRGHATLAGRNTTMALGNGAL